MGPNFSEEGITRDLEAMKETGVAGATIFHITSAVQESQAPTLNNPWPENTYRSSRWWGAMRHAAAEAERLGLKLGLHNTAGYSTTGGPWIDEESGMQCFVSSKTIIEGGRHVSVKLGQATPPPYRGRGGTGRTASFYRDIAAIAVPAGGTADPSDAIDISRYMKPDGTLDWTAPDGTWTIVRMGYAPTMATPHPLPDDLIRKSMEVDKMGRQNSILHWNEVLRPMEENLGKYLGNTFDHILIDSYEAGRQSWTEGFEKEFRKIKGYDPLPWLTGLVGTEEERRRFRTDLDDVIAELYRRNGFEVGRDFIHKYGMLLYSEPYGGPFNTLDNTLLADIPMGEFWTSSDGRIQPAVVASARAGGKRIIAAEAFTSRPEVSAWTEDPAFLKRSADGTFCCGVNRLVLHHWVHQPFDDRYRPAVDSAFSCEFHQLADFSKHTDERIMYFAGEVTYRTSFFLPDSLAGSGEVILDLGELHDIAEVKINGKDLGVWWYPPYSKSVKDAVRSGENSLEITVTVNWANRLIGDERYPADFEWGDDRGRLGRAIKAYPEWFIKGEPRPSERRTFVIWSYYREDSPLQSAGLIGPVTVRCLE